VVEIGAARMEIVALQYYAAYQRSIRRPPIRPPLGCGAAMWNCLVCAGFISHARA
jgi:hypothetical protein